MDCCVCTTMPLILRPPRNTICGSCYEGVRSIINMMNGLESDKTKAITNPTDSPVSRRNSSKASYDSFHNSYSSFEKLCIKKYTYNQKDCFFTFLVCRHLMIA